MPEPWERNHRPQPLQPTSSPAEFQDFCLAVFLFILLFILILVFFIIFSWVPQLPKLPQLILLLRGLVLVQVADGLQVGLGDALHSWGGERTQGGQGQPSRGSSPRMQLKQRRCPKEPKVKGKGPQFTSLGEPNQGGSKRGYI